MLKSRFTAAAGLVLLAASNLPAQQPATQITRAQGTIKVDAVLDDAGWAGADRIKSFVEYEPREGAEPPVVTEVMLKYDDENVYVAFIAHDPNPNAIRATLQPRDRFWSTDDWIGVMLNPHGDASVAYFFAANPLGVQGDMQMTTSSEDESIDFIYKAEGKVTAEGYI
ncbi:MAG TPA: carbohydrate binding family 9 domain-containing protein, partial [Longimicrobiales bacterium]